jgi:hypothetical protein
MVLQKDACLLCFNLRVIFLLVISIIGVTDEYPYGRLVDDQFHARFWNKFYFVFKIRLE